jgi:C4-dicarboxylate transporter, DctQ subunit
MNQTTSWWQKRANDIAVVLMGALFLSFVLQITFRYVFNKPLEWTLEACLTTWLWTVFWGCAFCLRDRDHVRFDILYNYVRPGTRRVFAGLCALAMVLGFLAALPGTWDFVSFLTIKKSPSLRIPLAYVFSIYLVFMVAVIVMYGVRLWHIVRNPQFGADDAAEAS